MSLFERARPFLEPAFDLFRNPDTAIFLCLVILGGLVLSIIAFRGWVIRRHASGLRSLNRSLRRIGSRAAFTSDFPDLDERFRKVRWLAHGW
jgi:hypothetical protein